MDDLIKKILEEGMGSVIDKRANSLLLSDEEYQKNCRELDNLERKYMKLDLSKNAEMIVDNYITCLDTVNSRANELYYMAGIRDAVLFLTKIGLINEK